MRRGRKLIRKKKAVKLPAPFRERKVLFPKIVTEYFIQGGEHCFLRMVGEEPHAVPLSNFTARIVRVAVRDNGVVGEEERRFDIEGYLASSSPLLAVQGLPASEFDDMGWVCNRWGPSAYIRAGNSKTKLAEAIQRSSDAPVDLIHTHTGWRKIDGQWLYLTYGGAVGAQGHRSDVQVELPADLAAYSLPPTTPEEAHQGMGASLRLLKEVADPVVAFPLYAATFRAVLAEALPMSCTLSIYGRTGSGKTPLALLFLRHFGNDFEEKHLASFSSTANSQEFVLFTLKDALCVVDDIKDASREGQAKLDRLVRSQANHAARGRLASNLTQRPGRPPRGGLITTCEDLAGQTSLHARMLIIQFERSLFWMPREEAQKLAPLLPAAMIGFIQWLAPQIDALKRSLPSAFEQLRQRAEADLRKLSSDGQAPHLRIASNIADIYMGFDLAMRFAAEARACDNDESKRLREQAWEALVRLGLAQAQAIERDRPTLKFLTSLMALISNERAVLGDEPPSSKSRLLDPKIYHLGWLDTERIYLDPGIAYEAALQSCLRSGESLPSKDALFCSLREEGFSRCDPGRCTKRIDAGDSRVRMLVLERRAIRRALGDVPWAEKKMDPSELPDPDVYGDASEGTIQ